MYVNYSTKSVQVFWVCIQHECMTLFGHPQRARQRVKLATHKQICSTIEARSSIMLLTLFIPNYLATSGKVVGERRVGPAVIRSTLLDLSVS